MSTSRHFYNTNTGRQNAQNAAADKHNSIKSPDVSAISPVVANRLIASRTAYNEGMLLVESKEAAQGKTSKVVIANRKILDIYIRSYFKVLNIGIDLCLIPEEARAYFGLDISNKKLPDTDTDAKLIHWANEVVTGDAERIDKGGIEIIMPSQAGFTIVFTNAKTAITNNETAKDDLTNAHIAVKNLNVEADNVILRTWNEVETTFSELPAATMRTKSRQYGVKYVSVGKPALITGKYTDSKTGLPLPDVSVHLEGITNKETSDPDGNFKLGTSQYGDLVLISTLKDYKVSETNITMENGVDIVVNIVLVHI